MHTLSEAESVLGMQYCRVSEQTMHNNILLNFRQKHITQFSRSEYNCVVFSLVHGTRCEGEGEDWLPRIYPPILLKIIHGVWAEICTLTKQS